jgi:hypothetical protein
MSWKDVRTYRSRDSVEHEVNGKSVRFYPNRMRLLPELTELSVPIGKALAELLDPSRTDSAMTEKVMVQGETTIKESSVTPPSPEVSKARAAARDGAIEALLKALGDPRNRLSLGRLLMDSLADDFPYAAERPAAEVEGFLYGADGVEGLDLPLLAQLVSGWIKANAKQFSRVGELVAARLGDLGGVMAPPQPSPSTDPRPSSGSDSRIPSSPPSPPASN